MTHVSQPDSPPADQVLDKWLQASFTQEHPARKAWNELRRACLPSPGMHAVWTRDGGPVLDLPVTRWGLPFARITTMHSPGAPVRWALAADQSATMIEPLMLDAKCAAGPTAEGLLSDPATPYWVGRALRSALDRDPVKAAAEAEVIARLLARRADAVLQAALKPNKPSFWTPL